MSRYILTLHGYRFPPLNQLLGRNPHVIAKAKRKADNMVRVSRDVGRIPMVREDSEVLASAKAIGLDPRVLRAGNTIVEPCPRRVRLAVDLRPLKRNRKGQFEVNDQRLDPDAPWKLVLDSLVNAGLLVDDAERWCRFDPRITYTTAPPGQPWGTKIILEEIVMLTPERTREITIAFGSAIRNHRGSFDSLYHILEDHNQSAQKISYSEFQEFLSEPLGRLLMHGS